MLRDVLSRIEDRLTERNLSATAASKLAGLSEDAIRNMRRAVEKDERQGVSTATLMALAPVLGTTAGWLIEGGDADEPLHVPVIGLVGADASGEVIFTTGQESGDTVPLPPGGTSKAVALEVKGHSMRALTDDGGLIYFENQHTPPTPDMIGNVCIVETEDHRVLVKRLLKGSGPGLYDLESVVGPTISDVRLIWAAEPTAIIPPKQARAIIRRAHERQVA